jgi:O-methyltransferase
MALIRRFDPPAIMSEIGNPLGVSRKDLEQAVGRLQDLTVLIPEISLTTPAQMPVDLFTDQDDRFRKILRTARGFTMGTPELCYALYQAVGYISAKKIPGAIVESGVWRGGNIALCALALLEQADTSRDFFLFDTFDWSWPDLSQYDSTIQQSSAEKRNAALKQRRNAPQRKLDTQLVSKDRVSEYLESTGYPSEKFHLVKGLVQDTIPDQAPAEIALLRLDTDLYESTYHELMHLYPRLVSGGILLIDDYPTEHGCVKAVEQYFSEVGSRPFLSRIHTQGRIGIKP